MALESPIKKDGYWVLDSTSSINVSGGLSAVRYYPNEDRGVIQGYCSFDFPINPKEAKQFKRGGRTAEQSEKRSIQLKRLSALRHYVKNQ